MFGVALFGHSSITDAKFQHVASVLAGFFLYISSPATSCDCVRLIFPLTEWLDNDEDGCADIPLVVSKVTFPSVLVPEISAHTQKFKIISMDISFT